MGLLLFDVSVLKDEIKNCSKNCLEQIMKLLPDKLTVKSKDLMGKNRFFVKFK